MSVLPSLIAALERAAGDSLVLRSGERPHVFSGDTRHDVGTNMLSVTAVEALASQILSGEAQQELITRSRVEEVLAFEVAGGSLTARAERSGTGCYLELRRHRRSPSVAIGDTPVAAAAEEPVSSAVPQPSAEEDVDDEVPVPIPDFASPAPEYLMVSATAFDAPDAAAAQAPTGVAPEPSAADVVGVEECETPDSPSPAIAGPPAVGAGHFEPASDPVEGAPPRDEKGSAVDGPYVPVDVASRQLAAAPAAVRPDQSDLETLLVAATRRGATALYLRAGQTPAARIDDRVQPLDVGAMTATSLQRVLADCAAGRDGWGTGADGEWVRSSEQAGTVRCYAFEDQSGDGLVVQFSPRGPVAGLQKHVPRQVRRVFEAEDGLIVVAAPSESDLLAMVAAVTELAGIARGGFIVSLEPATSRSLTVAGAFVSERNLRGSVAEAAATIRRAAQEAPDILAVVATDPAVAAHVAASATARGRVVILGMVAQTALRALEAIVSAADRDVEPDVRRALAAALRAGFSYHGLRRLGGGRATVHDVIVGTSDVRARLERGDFAGIEQAQRQGHEGMRTLDAALARAVSRRQVALRHAAACAGDRAELVALTRKHVRERRRLIRDQRSTERRAGVLRAITMG